MVETSVMVMEIGGSKPGWCHGDRGRWLKDRRLPTYFTPILIHFMDQFKGGFQAK